MSDSYGNMVVSFSENFKGNKEKIVEYMNNHLFCINGGAKINDSYIGSCKYSDLTVFSFHPVKIITTAEGGVALTNNENLAKKMNLHRSHGVTRNKEEMTDEEIISELVTISEMLLLKLHCC